jgi:hypothetical protein
MIGIVGGSAKGGLDVASIPKIRPKSKKKIRLDQFFGHALI